MEQLILKPLKLCDGKELTSMVEEIKKELNEVEVEICKQQERFDELRHQITIEIVPFAKETIKKVVENGVKSDPEHTKSLDRAVLVEMKQRLGDTLERCEQIVKETLKDDSYWLHVSYKTAPNDRYRGYEDKKQAEALIHQGIRAIIGEAERILIDYKYMRVSNQSAQVYNTISKYDYSREKRPSSRHIYKGYISLPKSVEDKICQYGKGIDTLCDILWKQRDVQERLSQQEALDIWDEL